MRDLKGNMIGKIGPENHKNPIPGFRETLAAHHLSLTRLKTTTLQINMGLLCNQECRHCHLEAGPHRKEIMTGETVESIIAAAGQGDFETVDITGGAPELNPHLPRLISGLSPLIPRLLVRTNLTALNTEPGKGLPELFADHGVVIIASLPASNPSQTDAQRGPGTFQKSMEVLQFLNTLGYGQADSRLELNLVSNPVGAFLPSAQGSVEARFKQDLYKKWGIAFNHLYTFANAPLGRFLNWLTESDNRDLYLKKLVESFNPLAVENVMCRTMVSISWDGILFDCDFNLARGLYLGGKKTCLSDLKEALRPGRPIAVSNHCYACTAGAGFT
jgi:radical SAM/Cys-rich protein